MFMQHPIRLLCSFALMAAAAGAAEAQNVRILGRSTPIPTGGFIVQWPNSGFETRLVGKSVIATIEDDGNNWLNVEVDGQLSQIALNPGVNTYRLFSGAMGTHTIRVTRRTGSPSGVTRFIEIRADGALQKTETPEKRILVIGDSVTSGYGVEGLDRTCSYSRATHNAELTYPAITARAFGADLQSISVDGGGLVRNYEGDDLTMKTLAWRTLAEYTTLASVTVWKPQVIVINLGANDFSAGDPGDTFDEAYTTLLRKLRYAWPEAQIYGAIGGMLHGETYKAARSSVFGAVEEVRTAGDQKTHFIEFTPSAAGRRYGCDWHPGMDAQKSMAAQLETVLGKDLGWKPGPATSPQSPLVASGVPAPANTGALPVSLR
jgi:lysophospholipase L1-like esterase